MKYRARALRVTRRIEYDVLEAAYSARPIILDVAQPFFLAANADRFVPYADRSFSVVMSITARMNAGEFRRVLREDGRLLVAIPAADDLIELRSPAGGEGRDRVDYV